MISLNCPIVTIYKSFDISAMLVSLLGSDPLKDVVITTLGSIC